MDNLDTSKLVALQVEQLDKEKRELSERLRIVAKRVDHLERAMRKEERPLLALDYERQQAEDQATYQVNHQVTIAAARQRHQDDIETKKRMGRMMADYYARRQEIAGKREEEFQRKREEARKKTDDEKAKRRATVLKQREAERKKREEEERIQREEEAEQARLEEGSPYIGPLVIPADTFSSRTKIG
jgi:translation initiation factor 3 subunit A